MVTFTVLVRKKAMYILAMKFELCDFGISAYELSALIFIVQTGIAHIKVNSKICTDISIFLYLT